MIHGNFLYVLRRFNRAKPSDCSLLHSFKKIRNPLHRKNHLALFPFHLFRLHRLTKKKGKKLDTKLQTQPLTFWTTLIYWKGNHFDINYFPYLQVSIVHIYCKQNPFTVH